MNMKTLTFVILVIFTGFAQYASADVAPIIRIACHSNNPSYPFQLYGRLQEIANRHGQGYMDLTVTLPNGQFHRNGMGQSWSENSIEYSDSHARATFINASSPSDISTLTINGQSETMICRFSNPTSDSSNNGESSGFHHNTH
jgi:hypothetical protein